MDSNAKYDKAFIESFSIEKDKLGSSLEYNSIAEWDSVGHMTLMGELEDAFNIQMEMDDIIDFASYNKGKELLKKYGISF